MVNYHEKMVQNRWYLRYYSVSVQWNLCCCY